MPVDPARAKSLFLAAADLLDPAERAAFVARECGDDGQLRERVEALLGADDAAPLPAAPAATMDSVHSQWETEDYGGSTPQVGAVIAGKYTLAEVIGEGGMGSVWRAKQTAPVKRFVAVKLIKAGMDSRQVLARFEAERQALALMDHPNIAKVLDGGLHDRRPFFVMELVKGVPITDYCDHHKLTPKQRLDLFVQACQAIQHAHQKGIIHRDIKPSNVLIALYDDKPVVKVIDFGVAKATGGTLTERTIDTGFGGVVGTPQYMSPEQATFNNVDIDTRSDVYALGVLLYELLTGSPPFSKPELEKKGLLEILRVVREEEPPRPSTKLSTADALPTLSANRGTEPKKLTWLLRNELDWIVMKALEKDRVRRYETANGFAADVQRYLAGEAVQAHPPSTAYRLRKFGRKHRPTLLAATAIALLLVGGVVVSAWQAVRATRAERAALRAQEAERERAEGERLAKLDAQEKEKLAVEQRVRAEKARDRTRDVLDAMTSSVARESLRTQQELSEEQKTFLTEVLTYYREFAGEKADDEQSRARIAGAAYRVGHIEYQMRRKEQGIAAMQMARDGYRTLAADFPAVPAYRVGLGLSLSHLGSLAAGRTEAVEQYRQALAIFEKVAADFPALPEYQWHLGKCRVHLARSLISQGERAEAEKLLHDALPIFEKLAAELPAMDEYRGYLAFSYSLVGNLQASQGKRAEAEERYYKTLAIMEKLVADFPRVPDHRWSLAGRYMDLGGLLSSWGRRTEAEELYRKALPILEKLVAEFPLAPHYRHYLGRSYHVYGDYVRQGGQPRESLGWYDKAFAMLVPADRAEPRVAASNPWLRDCYLGRARAYDALGKPAEAVKDWDRAIELSPPAQQLGFRARRATSRLRAGMVADAVAEVAELSKSPSWDARQWYGFACVYAVASRTIVEPSQQHADRAMEMLRKAVQTGYRDASNMTKDNDLDPVRHREDFKKLIAELEVKAEKK